MRFFTITFLLVLLGFSRAFAADLESNIPIFNFKLKPSEIASESLILKNRSNRLVEIYAFVEPFFARDGSNRIVEWILLNRVPFTLGPGQSKSIGFSVEPNLAAQPGIYHAKISFALGANREDASRRRGTSDSQVIVTTEIIREEVESLILSSFAPLDSTFMGDYVTFSYSLKNDGDTNLVPTGAIHIYNRWGKKVAKLPVNEKLESLKSGDSLESTIIWDAVPHSGKYKAFLEVNYGANAKRRVYDTAHFWIMPWNWIMGLVALSVMLAFWGTHKVLSWYHKEYGNWRYRKKKNSPAS